MVACDGTLNPCLYAGQYSEFVRFSWAFACRRQLPIVKLDERPYDVLPLSGLTKRRVRAPARSLGAEDRLVMKVPTADLESLAPQRPDGDSYGISYENIDDFLEGKCERRLKTDNKRRRHSAAAPHARMKTGIREAFNPTLNGTLIQGTA
jgi:hypothetical protein